MTPDPSWGPEDAEWFRSLLATERGQRLLERLTFYRPALALPSASAELTAQTAQLVSGYEKCVSEFLALRRADDAKEKAPVEAYPPLDDPTKWPTNP